MRIIVFFAATAILWMSICAMAAAQQPTPAPQPQQRLYMPDGQLISHPIVVYFSGEIPPGVKPALTLLRCRGFMKNAPQETLQLIDAAPNTSWFERVAGTNLPRTGTMMLFSAKDIKFNMKAMLRVTPLLSWKEGDAEHTLIGQSINIGNMPNTLGWAGALVGIGCAFIIALAWRFNKKPHHLLTGDDGRMSLSKTQIACWTLAVGGVVAAYGMLQLQLPEIPTSVVVLMGASLATGGLAYFETMRRGPLLDADGAPKPKVTTAWSDLITVSTAGQAPELSLSRAQMLFWTWLLIVLFLTKSYLDGVIWDVPWPLVALMGFSQAGYLAPKLPIGPTPPPAASTPPPIAQPDPLKP